VGEINARISAEGDSRLSFKLSQEKNHKKKREPLFGEALPHQIAVIRKKSKRGNPARGGKGSVNWQVRMGKKGQTTPGRGSRILISISNGNLSKLKEAQKWG